MIWLHLNLQVAERALFLWNSDHIQNLIKQNNKVILPIVLPALEQNARNHWNQAVRSLTINVSKIFSDFDPAFYEECMIKFREDEAQENDVKSKCEVRWKRLEEMAGIKAPTNEPVLVSPKSASHYASPGKVSRPQLEWSIKGGKSWKYKRGIMLDTKVLQIGFTSIECIYSKLFWHLLYVAGLWSLIYEILTRHKHVWLYSTIPLSKNRCRHVSVSVCAS